MPLRAARFGDAASIMHTTVVRVWLDGDKYALDQVLDDVMTDPTGVPGLLFVLLDIAVDVSVTLDPEVCDRLRDALLRIEQG